MSSKLLTLGLTKYLSIITSHNIRCVLKVSYGPRHCAICFSWHILFSLHELPEQSIPLLSSFLQVKKNSQKTKVELLSGRIQTQAPSENRRLHYSLKAWKGGGTSSKFPGCAQDTVGSGAGLMPDFQDKLNFALIKSNNIVGSQQLSKQYSKV